MTQHRTSPRTRLDRLAAALCLTSAGLTGWLYIKPRIGGLSTNLIGYGLKILGGALSPLLAMMGLLGAMLARRTRRPQIGVLGVVGAMLGATYVRRVSAPESDAHRIFTPAPTPQAKRLPRRWQPGRVAMQPRPSVARDLAFATVPGTDRELLCDLWQPGPGVRRSGIGMVFLHGGAWQAFDKDVLTRPFFRHLTAQGHVVMDVAYRVARETDMRGMLGDVKRAAAWLKAHGRAFDVDPARIVLAGGSAGGHLALLAAYTAGDPAYAPEDTRAVDTSVCGVIAYYPVTDLRTLTDHWSEQSMHPLVTAVGKALGYFAPDGYLPWSKLAARLFGAPLKELGDALLAYSPLAHAGPHCPPTLLIQGLHDHVIPVDDVLELHRTLVAVGADAAIVKLPMVEHAFDLIALQISPPAQAALYDVDRFLARLSAGATTL
jgi:acetyl esterase/lipase